MKIFLNFIFIIALALFSLSFVIHSSTFFDFNVQEKFPYIWIIHIGIFALMFPLILILNKYKDYKNKDFINNAPRWIKYIWAIFLIYGAFNFLFTLSFLKEGCSASIIQGKYYLTNKSKIVREITLEEYKKDKIYDIRLFSGHWMFFYIFISGTAYSVISYKENGKLINKK